MTNDELYIKLTTKLTTDIATKIAETVAASEKRLEEKLTRRMDEGFAAVADAISDGNDRHELLEHRVRELELWRKRRSHAA